MSFAPGRDPEIRGEFPRGLIEADTEEFCREVDDVAVRAAAEAVEVIAVELQAGFVVVVKRAFCHAVSADRQAVPFGGLPRRYGAFDAFAEIRGIILLVSYQYF